MQISQAIDKVKISHEDATESDNEDKQSKHKNRKVLFDGEDGRKNNSATKLQRDDDEIITSYKESPHFMKKHRKVMT